MNHGSAFLGPRRSNFDIEQVVGTEAIMDVEMNGVIQTRHDLHASRCRRSRAVTDVPEPEVDSVHGQRAVHDMVV